MRPFALSAALAMLLIVAPAAAAPPAQPAACAAAHCVYLPLAADDPQLELWGLSLGQTGGGHGDPFIYSYLETYVVNRGSAAHCDVVLGYRAELLVDGSAETREGEAAVSLVLPGELVSFGLDIFAPDAAVEILADETRLTEWRVAGCNYTELSFVEQRFEGTYVGYGYSGTVYNTMRNDTPYTLRDLSSCRPTADGGPGCPIEVAEVAPGEEVVYEYSVFVESAPWLPFPPQPAWLIGRYD